MMNKVAYRGGFVMIYSEDLSRRWGELPARETMIWVQDPATVGVGEAMLRAYRVTGDKFYLGAAEKVASALIYGQHPSGGWHYFIDFEPDRTEEWYEEVGFRCWGWEEFYHNYGNCTFDDSVTVDATRFLLHLYQETSEPVYKEVLLKALDFFLQSQYPNGAWPQRYPLDPEELTDGDIDYTEYYTFNDDVILGNIRFLLEAYRALGDDRYRRSAVRGMDFVLLSQLPSPQAGWAQQYGLDLKPAAARSYEPVALSTLDTVHNLSALGDFFLETGDRRYLDAIPPAIEWLEASVIPKSHSTEGHTHATFIEIGTNQPIYGHREGTTKETGRYWNDHNPENLLRGYGYTFNLNTKAMWERYQGLTKMGQSEIARAKREIESAPSSPMVALESVKGVISSLDERGAWVEDLTFPNTVDYMNNPPEKFRGIRTATFLKNANLLIDAIESAREGEKKLE
ncbi:MAG: pectate lyase [Candidatus Omnitrophica bacterium]|nr:pectate lyase [Candidatus Omnitrophota bacterium]